MGGLVALVGCSHPDLKPFEETLQSNKEIPEELRNRFEVKIADVPQEPTPTPSVQETASKTTASVSTAKAAPAPKKKKSFVIPNRRPNPDPIWVGEELIYDVTYIGVSAGSLVLNVFPFKELGGRRVYHVRATIKSSDFFSLFYRLNDYVESFFDYEGFFSHRFHLNMDESKQTRTSIELHDSEKKQTFYWDRLNHHKKGFNEKKEYKEIPAFPQDSLSAIYFLRAQPLKPGMVVRFPIVTEGNTWEAEGHVVRKERLDTVLGKISTIVVKPETKFQGVLKKRGESFLWFSDDDRRFLVRVEGKIKIGTVVMVLKEVKYGTAPDYVRGLGGTPPETPRDPAHSGP